MNELEQKVLSILKNDSRITHDKIAVMLGKTKDEIRAIVTELEKRGVIVKYSVVVNEQMLGEEKVEALIEVKVSPQHTKGFDSIAEDIYRFDEVKSVYLMSGAYDLAVFVEGRNLRQAATFVSEKLSAMDKVLSTATHFILKKYKTEGVVLEKGEGEKRLVIT